LLSQLHIQNVAVIENVSLELRPGFNVLTGETCGKSIYRLDHALPAEEPAGT
jgi:DNA repair ATPase RecN